MSGEHSEVGHRQRLRSRFLAGEPSSLTDEGLLELLLAYGIARRDVRPLARQLLEEFGDLSSVLSASTDDLEGVKGMGENTAVLLKLVEHLAHSPQGEELAAPSGKAAAAPKQAALFEPPSRPNSKPAMARKPSRKPPTRQGTGLFGKAILREAIDLLPGLPETDSINEIREYLRKALHFNSQETRQRNANYIISRMFPSGKADAALRHFAKTFARQRDLQEVCFYRFMKAEPLIEQITQNVLLQATSQGKLRRQRIAEYLKQKFPSSRSITTCTQAVVAAYTAGGIATADRTKITFGFRNMSIVAFAFVLHSEFPEPAMYDIAKLECSKPIRAMLWNPSQLLPSLYELRNRGLISKVSEIDSMRQFTTKWTLEQLVEHLATEGVKA